MRGRERFAPGGMAMRSIWTSRFVLVLIAVGANLAVGEATARLVGIRPITPPLEPVRVADEDSLLGWVNRPGVYSSWDTGYVPMTFWPEGRRATRSSPEEPGPANARVALVGGSFTQGFGVADERTFGWLLDTRFAGLAVDNYGTGGYGTYQSLLLLERLFQSAGFRPGLVVYGFAAFHGERNVGAYRHVVTLRTQVGRRFSPPHVLSEQGAVVHKEPFYVEPWPLEDTSALISLIHLGQLSWTLRGREQQIELVTRHLLARMDQLARDNESRLLVAILDDQPRPEPYTPFLQDQGIAFVNCTHPGYQDEPRLRLGRTRHPSHVLHAEWADCIAAWITGHLPENAR